MSYQFDFAAVLSRWPLLMEGIWVTIELTAVTTVAGILIGIFCAIVRTNGPGWARWIVGAYVEFIRNTPLLIQAYFLVFGLASVGAQLPLQLGGAIALIVNVGAYTTEIMRAGIESIQRGQIEAAKCLGLSRTQVYLHVVIRPAMERVYPALTSQYVLLMLASSILSAVGVDELFGMASRIQGDTFRNFEVFIVIGALYLALAFVVRLGFDLLAMLLFPRRRKLGTPL